MRFNWLLPPFDNVKMRQAVLQVVNQSDYMAVMAGDPENWRTCYSVYACLGYEETRGSEALSGPRDYDRAKKLIAEAGYHGEPVVLLDPADIPQLHAEAAVTADLLKRLGLNVEVATTEWGTVIKRIYSKDPIAQGGWNVFVTAFAAYDILNPAMTRNLRAPGAKGVLPGWADDERLEALRAAWFAATDDAARREIAAQIQARLRGRAVHSAGAVPRPRRVSLLPDGRGRRADRVPVEHREGSVGVSRPAVLPPRVSAPYGLTYTVSPSTRT
jgi:peptide/nickel transport system substrate-binding protein